MLNKLDKLALELYSEFGFATCSSEQQEIILQVFVQREVEQYIQSKNIN